MHRVLVVEDEKVILEMLQVVLLESGYVVDVCQSGNEAIEKLEEHKYHIICTDLAMENGTGIELLKYLQKAKMRPIVLVISGSTAIETKLMCYDLNVVDYITKPFDERLLVHKIKSLSNNFLPTLKLKLYADENAILINNEKIILSKMEYNLLELLYSFPNTIFSKYDLINELWCGNFNMSEKIVEVTVLRLRKQLGENNYIIKTHRGLGYSYEETNN